MTDALPRHVCRRWHGDWANFEPLRLRDALTGHAPAQATEVRTAWDETHWWIGFDAFDVKPWATLTERDGQLWNEEVVEVFFDPVGDLMGYFEVEINPLGAVTDLFLRRVASGWRKDFGWSVEGLIATAGVRADGWRADLAIPFAALGPDRPAVGSEWRVNFLRIDRPGGVGTEADLSAWSPTGVRNFHRAERFGVMTFAE